MFEKLFGFCKPKLNILIGIALVIVLAFSIGFVLIQFVFTESISESSHTNGELIFAHTICRHGERNMYESFPTNPWNSEKYWPVQNLIDTVTFKAGKRQHYELGKYLRERYASLIGNNGYSSNEVYVRSTDVDRVLMSAQVAMAGLFPADEKQNWNPKINWQPIPVHNVPEEQDYIIGSNPICERFDYAMNEFRNSTETKALLSEKRSLITYLENNSGRILDTLEEISYVYDDLLLEQMKGYQLPRWAEDVMRPGGDLEYLAKLHFTIYTHTDEMKKLRMGFLLREMLDHFMDKLNSSLLPDRKLWMYFAHDTTIASFLDTFDLFELHRPPYASCLFFELYKSDTENYVQLFYRNSTDADVPAMEIPNCGVKCPLNKFHELYQAILPIDSFERECQLI